MLLLSLLLLLSEQKKKSARDGPETLDEVDEPHSPSGYGPAGSVASRTTEWGSTIILTRVQAHIWSLLEAEIICLRRWRSAQCARAGANLIQFKFTKLKLNEMGGCLNIEQVEQLSFCV